MNIDVHAHYIPKNCLELWAPALDPQKVKKIRSADTMLQHCVD